VRLASDVSAPAGASIFDAAKTLWEKGLVVAEE
jgi:hypothetical protein